MKAVGSALRFYIAALLLVSMSAAAGGIPQQVVLYKNAAVPLPDQAQVRWLAPAAAYTAITVPAQFDALKANGAVVQSASVQAVWTARSPGGNTGAGIFVCPSQSQAGVQLVGCRALALFAANDSGPAYYTPGCSVNPGGPFPCRLDVTAALQAFIDEGTPSLYLVGVAYGNGANGPAIYDLEILINWAVP